MHIIKHHAHLVGHEIIINMIVMIKLIAWKIYLLENIENINETTTLKHEIFKNLKNKSKRQNEKHVKL